MFTSDLASAVSGTAAVFIAVGTPARRGDGHADLRYVYAAAEEIARALTEPAVIVTKSTVPVGTGDEIARIFKDNNAPDGTSVASNPEFLREGSAIRDFKVPDRIVVGAEDEHAREVLHEVYRPLFLNKAPILFTGRRTAELIKYAANAFLATKISFINEVADLCEVVGADVQEVAQGIGLDNRIGPKFLHAGPGYGGSCFPKDTLALLQTAQNAGVPMRIVSSVVAVNDDRKERMADRVCNALGGSLEGKKVAVLGLTFKPNTDDMRDAPSLALIAGLQRGGARVTAFDPVGIEHARRLLHGVDFAEDSYAVVDSADALVLVTEWDEFRALDLNRIAAAMRGNSLIDFRCIYRAEEAVAAGLSYFAVGRAPISALPRLRATHHPVQTRLSA
jgi:UDPglucose 6-dehydrogenase